MITQGLSEQIVTLFALSNLWITRHLFDAHQRRGASVLRETKGKTRDSYGQRAKFASSFRSFMTGRSESMACSDNP
jgi:hypothetical protein